MIELENEQERETEEWTMGQKWLNRLQYSSPSHSSSPNFLRLKIPPTVPQNPKSQKPTMQFQTIKKNKTQNGKNKTQNRKKKKKSKNWGLMEIMGKRRTIKDQNLSIPVCISIPNKQLLGVKWPKEWFWERKKQIKKKETNPPSLFLLFLTQEYFNRSSCYCANAFA